MSKRINRVVFFGSGAIGLPALDLLIKSPHIHVGALVTQPDRPAGRGLVVAPSPIKKAALGANITIFQPPRLRDSEGLEVSMKLQALNPDFFVVFAYGQILPPPFLELPRLACINLHASLLPRHRGASPIQSAILAGDRESGISLIHMTKELDAGDVIAMRRVRLNKRETGGSLHDRLAALAPPLLLEGIEAIANGIAERRPQDHSQATYSPKLDRESGRIDWNADATAIECLVRAMNPWPGAWTLMPSKKGIVRLKIHSVLCLVRQERSRVMTPGEIIGWDARGIRVAAGRGIIVLREVQQEGRQRMDAAAFAAGWGGRNPERFTGCDQQIVEGQKVEDPQPLRPAQ